MRQDQELQLFASLAQNQPRLVDWLREKLAADEQYLRAAVEPHMIYRSQGAAGRMVQMLDLLEKAPKVR